MDYAQPGAALAAVRPQLFEIKSAEPHSAGTGSPHPVRRLV